VEARSVGFLAHDCLCDRLGRDGVEGLELRRWDVAEGLVQAAVVEPAEVLDDAEFGVKARLEDAAGGELGLERAREALGHGVSWASATEPTEAAMPRSARRCL
jgi:hypothetical protein